MFISLDQVIEWLLVYRYFVLFPIMVIEGPIITIISGFFASLDILNFYIAYVVLIAADIAGDFIYYAIGRWGRFRFINKYGKYLGITEEKIEKLETYFDRHAKKTILFGKLTHAIGGPILVAAGLAEFSIWSFFIYNFIATIPKTLILLLLGYYFGQAYVQLSEYLDYFTYSVIGLLVITVIIYYLWRKAKKRYFKFLNNISSANKEN